MKTALYLIVALLVIDKNGLGKDHVTTFSSVSPNAISRSIGGPNPAYSVGASNIFINPALLGKLPEKQFQISNVVHSGFLQYIIGALSIPVSGDDDIGLGMFWASLPDAQEFNQGGFLGGTSDNYRLGVMFGYSRAFLLVPDRDQHQIPELFDCCR